MYRAVNYIGASPNSTVAIFKNYVPPNGLIKPLSVKLDLKIPGKPYVQVSWNLTQNT
jgi:hypothetical protein